MLERLPDGGERLAREFIGGRILKRLLLTADGVETEGELGADLAIDVDLVAVSALARLLHQQRPKITHHRSLGEDRTLATRVNLAEDN